MSMESLKKYASLVCLPVLIAAWPAWTNAQAVNENSAVIETSAEEIPLLSASDLEILVGRIALYPDDLLAIVLPASTYPLQLIQAERFLQEIENDPELKPDEDWDDSIVALVNYPEVVELMTDDLDKTWRLGEAVVAQQADVIAAIESFRDQAYAAGNLKSDTRQTVSQNDGVIEIVPIEEDVIYVPYYEPERVVVYQATPAYSYYPRPYPVYNYPYPYGYSFNHGFFWGVTTAFAVGWFSDSLHVYHHSYYGHPYYGHSYGHNYWYRQPSIYVHNNYYYNSHHNYNSGNRYGHGDYWQPHSGSTVNSHDQRVTRSRHYPGTRSGSGTGGEESEEVRFRQRTSTLSNQSSSIGRTQSNSRASAPSSKNSVSRSSVAKQQGSTVKFRERTASTVKPSIQFRERSTNAPQQFAANKSSQPSRSSAPSRSSSQPSRSSSQPSRSSSQPSRSSSQPSRSSSQPSRSSSQPSRSSSQPSRSSSQPSRSSSAPRKSQPSNSGSSSSNKVASASGAKSAQRSRSRR